MEKSSVPQIPGLGAPKPRGCGGAAVPPTGGLGGGSPAEIKEEANRHGTAQKVCPKTGPARTPAGWESPLSTLCEFLLFSSVSVGDAWTPKIDDVR